MRRGLKILDVQGARRRGFTLVELMFVVVLIGILATMAAPTMLRARNDRKAYDAAGRVTQLFRAARAHAIGRRAAVLVTMTSGGNGNFRMWEAVGANPGGGTNQTPLGSCGSPATWDASWNAATPARTANMVFLDGVDLNGSIETSLGIRSQILAPSSSTGAAVAYACFTPLGRTYFQTAADETIVPNFNGVAPLAGAFQIVITRTDGGSAVIGPRRRIVVPPTGAARLRSTGS